MRGDCLGRCEHEDVLTIEREDGLVRPDEWPESVQHDVPVLGEQRGPVVGPLLVDVVSAALVWHCRREEHTGREFRDVPDELPGATFWKVLGDFKGHCEVEAAIEPQRSVKTC